MEKKHQYQGLTKQEVEESRRLHGENILTPPEKASLWSQFLEKFNDPIIKILLVAHRKPSHLPCRRGQFHSSSVKNSGYASMA